MLAKVSQHWFKISKFHMKTISVCVCPWFVIGQSGFGGGACCLGCWALSRSLQAVNVSVVLQEPAGRESHRQAGHQDEPWRQRTALRPRTDGVHRPEPRGHQQGEDFLLCWSFQCKTPAGSCCCSLLLFCNINLWSSFCTFKTSFTRRLHMRGNKHSIS